MLLQEKSNGLQRTDGASWKERKVSHCLYLRGREIRRLQCSKERKGGNVRVEEVGKRFDDWVITLESAIVKER